MQIYEWVLLTVFHHSDKFSDQGRWHSGEIIFLVVHATSCNKILRELYEFMDKNSSR